jgi:argininosuccinate synthase
MAKKVVLGFSGGLDTTYCVRYLVTEKPAKCIVYL